MRNLVPPSRKDSTKIWLTISDFAGQNRYPDGDSHSEISFLASAENYIYEVSIHGDMTRFQVLEDRVKQINHIDFNRVRSLLATNEGLYEVEVEEMPQMVRSTSLPRLISHPELKGSFAVGHYVEAPYILAGSRMQIYFCAGPKRRASALIAK
jgi:hypothetical protein